MCLQIIGLIIKLMMRVIINGVHAHNPRTPSEIPEIIIIIKNMLNNRQKPIAGKDQRGKFFIHPTPNSTNIEIIGAQNKNKLINLGALIPELENAHARPNSPKGIVASKDVREENEVSIFNIFNVYVSIIFISYPGS